MILHPAVLTKSEALIPVQQMRWFPAIEANTPILSLLWPKKLATKPQNLQSRIVSLRNLCEKEKDLLPVTYVRGSSEPQMIAQHTLERDTFQYEIILEDEYPILVSAKTMIGTYAGMKDVSKLKGEIDVPCIRHVRGDNFKAQRRSIKVNKVSTVTLGIKLAVWEQPDRVNHTNGYLVTGPGLVLG